MNSLVICRGRKDVVVATAPATLERLLFHTTAAKVMVPTPTGKPTWLTVDKVTTIEPAP